MNTLTRKDIPPTYTCSWNIAECSIKVQSDLDIYYTQGGTDYPFLSCRLIRKLYLDSSTVVWNGNVCNGGEAINAHFDALPASEHVINSLDTQPLVESLNPNEMAIAVSVFGTVKYQNNKNKAFTQNFTLSSQGTVWKIVSDVFRFLEKP
ncbi:NTF2-related export protein 2-like isoform X2 [Haliotis asinina]|uniref:NTF2-related export protein 2-like isoform X2 n=1 Tax=Haliotis asinina TaxID=109174 RepID=UPI003531FC45